MTIKKNPFTIHFIHSFYFHTCLRQLQFPYSLSLDLLRTLKEAIAFFCKDIFNDEEKFGTKYIFHPKIFRSRINMKMLPSYGYQHYVDEKHSHQVPMLGSRYVALCKLLLVSTKFGYKFVRCYASLQYNNKHNYNKTIGDLMECSKLMMTYLYSEFWHSNQTQSTRLGCLPPRVGL